MVVAIYIGLTWFFLGFSHPCEFYFRLSVRPWLEQEIASRTKLTEREKQNLPRTIYESVYQLSPAQCVWRTFTGRKDWTP
jgi:hypothetical protein